MSSNCRRTANRRSRLAVVRSMSCCACGAPPPNHAHHVTFKRGLGQKASDRDVMPLCWLCHSEFHGAYGHFRDWTHEKRTEWQKEQLELLWGALRQSAF